MRYIKKYLLSMMVLLTVSVLFWSAYAATKAPTEDAPTDAKLPVEQMQQFTKAMSFIKEYYVTEPKDSALLESGIRGMLEGLDPHSAYLDADAYEDLKVSTTGKFGGLGIEVTMENGFVKVVSPIDDTPAARAGIKPGDLIIRINDTPVKGIDLREAVDMMRGEKGSNITLTIAREGEPKPLIFKLKRDEIHVASTKYRLLEPGYGYLRVTHFQEESVGNVMKAVKAMQDESKGNLKGLVLDLRNNPGGILEGAVAISDAFLDSKKLGSNQLIVYTKGRIPSSDMEEKATPGDILNGKPMVVLINEGSASASEIVAGALQDHKRAILMGSTSFGKGSVQTVLPLSDKTGLKLTTALYYTPNGRSIQAAGIVPDIEIKDVTVTKKADDDDGLSIKEADLQGHLVHAKDSQSGKIPAEKPVEPTTETTTTPAPAAVPSTADLMQEDYPLYEALTLLKGLSIIKSGGA